MRKTLLLWALLMPVGGCSCMNNTERGATGGAIVGGAVGTVVGAAVGRPLTGMAAGAALGGTVGAVDGNAQDRREQRYANQVAAVNAQQARNQMTLTDIIQMAQRQVPEHIILNAINTSGSVFTLSANDIVDLRQQGVSDRVIAEMQSRTPRPVVVRPGPVVVYEPYPPPPPVGVGVGVIYRR